MSQAFCKHTRQRMAMPKGKSLLQRMKVLAVKSREGCTKPYKSNSKLRKCSITLTHSAMQADYKEGQ